MEIDDSIVQAYLRGDPTEAYHDSWIYCSFGRGQLFEKPDPQKCGWVADLCAKLQQQILDYVPRNDSVVRSLFPNFDAVARDYTIMLVVGFPDPYDAMVVENAGREYMVFDLVQFGPESLDEEYSCHRVLTHELIHICLHRIFPKPTQLTYVGELDYTAFDEGFAHALTYPDDWESFQFDDFLVGKYEAAKERLAHALRETVAAKQHEYLISSDTGDYWDKYASMSGKLFLINNKERIQDILQGGWKGFAHRILNDHRVLK